MAESFVVKLDTREVERSLSRFARATPRMAAAALNRTRKGVATTWKNAVYEDIGGLKKGAIAKQLKHRKATAQKLQAAVIVRDRPIPLIHFGARGKEPSRGQGRGVSYKIFNKRRRRRHAFIATMPSGHRGVFERTSKKRLSIIERYGPSVHRLFQKHLPKARARASKQFPKELKGLMQKEAAKRSA